MNKTIHSTMSPDKKKIGKLIEKKPVSDYEAGKIIPEKTGNLNPPQKP